MTLFHTMMSLMIGTWSGVAVAGGWTSGGGELLEDAINPWFIQKGPDKKIIRYCVEADEVNFGLTTNELSRQVRAAFDFWSEEFLSAHVAGNSSMDANKVYVGRESFFEIPCSGAELIRFQFGVLSQAQLTKFEEMGQDPRKMVGIAVRTDYDEGSLVGRGFIYISPAKGPLAMTGRDVIEDPWTSNGQSNLFSVLLHEIGHVFGVHHNGTHQDLMGAGFPEYAVSKNNRGYHANKGVFKVPQGLALFSMCFPEGVMPGVIRKFFQIDPAHRCVSANILGSKLRIMSRINYDDAWVPVGEVKFEATHIQKMEPLVRLWLPDAQKIYESVPDYLGRILLGPQVVYRQSTGFYQTSDRTVQHHVTVHYSPNRMQLDGIYEGKIHPAILISY